MEDQEKKILETALAPKSAEVDGQKVEQHSIRDLIEAAKFAASARVAKSGRLGIRIAKMIPGGTE